MKNKQAIILLFAANSISGFAQGLSMIAIPWYFINMMNRSTDFGMLYFSVTFISFFWGFYSGSLVDKYNRKTIFLTTSIFGCIVMGSIAAFGFIHGVIPWLLIGLAFAVTVFIFNIHYPNLYAFAQEITEPKNYHRITAWIEIQGQLASAMAGAISAVLLAGTAGGSLSVFGFPVNVGFEIQPWQLHEIFLVDAITYVISVVLIFFMRYNSLSERKAEPEPLVVRLKIGIQFLRYNPIIFIFGVASYFVFATILVTSFYLLPIYVNGHLNESADVFAISEMYYAFGAIAAGLLINKIFQSTSPVRGVIILTFITAAVYFSMIPNKVLMIFYAGLFLIGISNAGIRILRMTYLFNHVPNSVIGRAGSIFNMTNVSFRLLFLFAFTIPFFHQDNNVIFALLALGIFCVIGATIMLVWYNRIISKARIEGV